MRAYRRAKWGMILIAAVLATGCGHDSGPAGSAGPPGPAGPQGPPGGGGGPIVAVPSNTAPATDAAAASWAALSMRVTVTGVSVNSPPVVNFTVTDESGVPVKGLGNLSRSSTATAAGLTNLAFSIAKLVPGTDGAPSQWVSYIVTTVPTTTAAAAPSRPSTDNTGTLVDHGDGTYTYTFYRDIQQIKAQVDGMTVSAPNNKADLGDLTYDPSRVHRLTIQLSGNAPGTGTNTPNGVEVSGYPGVPLIKAVDVIYDFNPATLQAVTDSGRDIVATAKCNECHQQLGGIPGDNPESSGAGFHGGARSETRYCVVCHTEQRKYGRTEAGYDPNTLTFTSSSTYVVDGRAVGNLPNHIHKTHMGEHLAKKNYNYGGLLYNETLFPQDLRNCTKCHDGSATSTAQTAQGDNWKNMPSRRACGACHDGVNFATGAGVTVADALAGLTQTTRFNGLAHGGGAQSDDSTCTQCHTPDAIDEAHLPITPPNTQSALHVAGGSANVNAAWIASNPSRLPAGAIKVTYDIQSVARNAGKQPVMVFRLLQNGQRADLNDFATATPNPATGAKEIWDNFMGAPSAYFVFAVPQDGISQPADFNANASGYLRNIWNGTATGSGAGTLTGPDANGYYTVTLTGVQVPDSAVMLTGGLGFSYSVTGTLPLTQTNVDSECSLAFDPLRPRPNQCYAVAPSPIGATNKIGGLIVIAPNATKVANGYAGRRPIVEDARCNKCHQELGAFTTDAFHGGQRNDGSTCAWCHRPNQTSSGWSADSTSYIHSIHGGNKRTEPFTWHAAAVGESFAEIKFPGILRNCEGCHVRGAYDFSNPASQSALPNRLYRTVATGFFALDVGNTVPTYVGASCTAGTSAPQSDLGAYSLSPYVAGYPANYGTGFSYNAGLTASSSCTTDGVAVSNPSGGTLQADPRSLVNSPIATACFSCHDTSLARTHIEINGGSIYAPRGTSLATTETCLICHDTGRIADIKVMHAK
jgi:OmcA/MtrC family decaheme c-type cytochrome